MIFHIYVKWVADKQTERQRDRETDGQTNGQTVDVCVFIRIQDSIFCPLEGVVDYFLASLYL